MRPDDLIGNAGDLTPAEEAERAEARRAGAAEHYAGEPVGELHPDDLDALGDFTVVEPSERPAIAPRGYSEELSAGVRGEKVVAEVVVGGVPKSLYAKPPECRHELSYTQQVVIARLVNEAGGLVGWRAQLKVRCGECGTQFRFLPLPLSATVDVDVRYRAENRADAATNADRTELGAMMEPVPEGERVDEWAAIGGTQPVGTQHVPTLGEIGGA